MIKPVPLGAGGSNLIGTCSKSVTHRRFRPNKESCRGAKGRFLNVIFDRIKLRKLDLPEDTATKRSCWVYYTRMHSLYPYVRGHSIVYFIYNTHRRGLAELLILVKRQCEGQIRWDKRGSFSHVFFVSVFK